MYCDDSYSEISERYNWGEGMWLPSSSQTLKLIFRRSTFCSLLTMSEATSYLHLQLSINQL